MDENLQSVELSRAGEVEPADRIEEPSKKKAGLSGLFRGPLGMAICCAAPLLLIAAIAFFGLSLGAIASGALNLLALLACPLGMYLMMRNMSKN